MSARNLARGTLFVHYRIEAVLGRGGVGVVYLAEDLRLKRRVALKVLSPALAEDDRFRARFLSESELAASLDHANVIPVYEAGDADGSLYIAMRYVEGSDLKAQLAEGPLSDEQVVAVADQIGSALDAAHERGLVHGDVKPSNVLIDGRGHAYLADFGLTKRIGAERAADGDAQLMGTIDYVAPEQIRGEEADGRADIYSLGCLIHECLTGRQPFKRGNDGATLYAHLEDEPPEIGSPVDPVIARALAKRPDERYQSCAELAEDARAALGVPAPRRSRVPVAIAVVAVLVAASALTAFFVFRGGGSNGTKLTGRLIAIDASTNRVRDSIRVDGDPSAVAAGPSGIWVASRQGPDVVRVDPRTGNLTRIGTAGTPIGLALSGSLLFVADDDGTLRTIDTDTATLIADVVETSGADAIASDSDAWSAANRKDVLGVAPSNFTAGVLRGIRLPDAIPLNETNERREATGVAVADGVTWVTGDTLDRRLWRLVNDVSKGPVFSSIRLPFAPSSVAAGGGAVWVTAQLGDVVARIDPGTNRTTATIKVGREPLAVAVGERAVWVANTIDSTVSRIDPATDRVTATIPLGANPTALAVHGSSVWVVGDER
jgi:YVTN family beta-propeller protein